MTLILMGYKVISHKNDALSQYSAEGVCKIILLQSTNIITECGQLAGQEVQRALINQLPSLSIHFILDHAAHKFRFVHHHGIEKYQDLAQMILAARAANRPHRAGLNGYGFTG